MKLLRYWFCGVLLSVSLLTSSCTNVDSSHEPAKDIQTVSVEENLPSQNAVSAEPETVLNTTKPLKSSLVCRSLHINRLTCIHRVEPSYPNECKELGTQGTIIVEMLISLNGDVEKVVILRSLGCDEMDETALSAVKQWKFEIPQEIIDIEDCPIHGKDCPLVMTGTINFGDDQL